MSIIRRALEGRVDAQPKWQGTVPLTSSTILTAMGLDPKGTAVNFNTAIGVPAAYRAASLLTAQVASTPKYVEDKKTGKRVEDHELIFDPHPMMDEFNFWELVENHLLFAGNFYAIITGTKGSVKKLTPLHPQAVEPKAVVKKTGSGQGRRVEWVDTVYVVDLGGQKVGIPADEIFHIPGMGFDGLNGISVIQACKRTFEMAINSDEFAAKFYGNGTLASGILTTEKRLDEKAALALKQRWRTKVQGIENAYDIVVLDSGTTFEQISLSPQDAQWIEARRFNVRDQARIFGVHPNLLFEHDTKVGESGAEQTSINFVAFTLANWTNRIQAAVTKQLLPTGQRMRFDLENIVRPDERTRSSAAVMWRTSRVKSIDELRVKEGLAPLNTTESTDPLWFPEGQGDATDPGTNQGKPEQPVPGDQEPTNDSNSTPQND